MIQGLDHSGITECVFTPNEVNTSRSLNSGQGLVLTTGHPFWTATVRVETPTRQSKAIWSSWIATRQATLAPFLLSRSFRLKPRGGDVTETGLAVASVNKGASTITLSGAGTYTAKIGDMISYYTAAGGYWIGEVTGEAAASGGNVTIPVWPFPATPHASTARPRRMYPFGEFYLDGRVARPETRDPDYLEFDARQLIRVSGDDVSPFTPPASGVNAAFVETLAL